MKLYNTLSGQIDPFQPAGPLVTLYVCGITPYDTTHLGHAFTYTSVDILIRYLESRGSEIRYVQNVTDLDDDILKKAKQVNEDWRALGNRWTRHYIEDMQALNVRPPDLYPRATDVIPDIILTVTQLLGVGVAYAVNGSVYFSVDAWNEFGKLCNIGRPDMLPLANERGNHPDDPQKRDPLDFVLWQAQAPGEPAWDSPWGPGRPGWHIECSTMATRFLGKTVDIHSGGMDLCFPHHECEIAQVEPITGEQPFVRTWMHIAMVRHEGEKMSKSLGNLVMVRDLMKVYPPDGIRLYLAGNHYRTPWAYDVRGLEKAVVLADKLAQASFVAGGKTDPISPEPSAAAFTAAMDDDLNTPQALNVLESLADQILSAAQAGRQISDAQAMLRTYATVFGLRLDQPQPEERVIQGWRAHAQKFGA